MYNLRVSEGVVKEYTPTHDENALHQILLQVCDNHIFKDAFGIISDYTIDPKRICKECNIPLRQQPNQSYWVCRVCDQAFHQQCRVVDWMLEYLPPHGDHPSLPDEVSSQMYGVCVECASNAVFCRICGKCLELCEVCGERFHTHIHCHDYHFPHEFQCRRKHKEYSMDIFEFTTLDDDFSFGLDH